MKYGRNLKHVTKKNPPMTIALSQGENQTNV